MALNLFGVFEWGGFAQSMTSNVSAQGRYADAFLAGVLATVVATPCTAPFMGAAVGFTLAQPAAVSLAVFAMLGVGMALPVLALSFFPQALQEAPEARPVDGDLQAGDGLPALRHRDLARVGAGRAGGQRRGAARCWRGSSCSPSARGSTGAGRDPKASARFVFAALFAAAGLWLALAGRQRRAAARRAPPSRAPGEIAVAAVVAGEARGAARGRHAGVRRLHRRMVRHLPGEQARGAQPRRGREGARRPRRRGAQGRLDATTIRASPRRSRSSAATRCRSTRSMRPGSRSRRCCPRCSPPRSSSTRSRSCPQPGRRQPPTSPHADTQETP